MFRSLMVYEMGTGVQAVRMHIDVAPLTYTQALQMASPKLGRLRRYIVWNIAGEPIKLIDKTFTER